MRETLFLRAIMSHGSSSPASKEHDLVILLNRYEDETMITRPDKTQVLLMG